MPDFTGDRSSIAENISDLNRPSNSPESTGSLQLSGIAYRPDVYPYSLSLPKNVDGDRNDSCSFMLGGS